MSLVVKSKETTWVNMTSTEDKVEYCGDDKKKKKEEETRTKQGTQSQAERDKEMERKNGG